MSIEPDAMIWACALKVLEDHGARAPVVVAERIGALALQGDSDGVDRWKAIAVRLDRLDATSASNVTH